MAATACAVRVHICALDQALALRCWGDSHEADAAHSAGLTVSIPLDGASLWDKPPVKTFKHPLPLPSACRGQGHRAPDMQPAMKVVIEICIVLEVPEGLWAMCLAVCRHVPFPPCRAFRWERMDAEDQQAADRDAAHQKGPSHEDAAHLLGEGMWERHTEMRYL